MKANRFKMVIVVTLLASFFSSCIRQQKTWILQDEDSKNIVTQFTNSKKTTYKVQTGDNLYINIYSTDKATSAYFQTNFPTVMNQTYLYLNSYVVNEEGYLTFSFIDKMFVKGQTVEQIQQQLQTTMNTYFKDVTVSVKLVSFFVSIIGEVESPGKFNIPQEHANLLEIVALAGGFKEYADRNQLAVIRQTESGSEMNYIDLTDKSMLSSNYFYLMPNDIIYIKSLKSKSWTYEKLPWGILISSLSLIIAILAFTQ